ncbi:MAG: PDZ domain-containing protein, partial [Acidobacteria bacterium]|nr:PDZ domain-containing protein [Acidobacteriota bacterium]
MSIKHLSKLACLLVAAACGANVSAQSAPEGEGDAGEPLRRAAAQVWTLAGGNFLGVQTEDLTRENMGRFQLSGEPRGVGVWQVVEGGPAAKAGLQQGDVIVRFDSEQVTSAAKLQRLISEAAPEQAVRLAILRGGAEREVVVKLGRRTEGAFGSLRLPEGQGFRWDGEGWKRRPEKWKKFGDEWKQQGDEWERQGEKWKLDGEELRRQLENMPRLDNLPGGNFAFAFISGRRIGVATTALTEQLADYFGVSERRGLL